jgi:large subunit ribosomal protein L21
MYAIIKTGGKQYRVQPGQSLLIERVTADAGDTIDLRPLLYVDGDDLVDGERLSDVTVQARILAHERGPKLRIVKFKPKRGYKRRTGHRQELTRIEVTTVGRTKAGPRDAKANSVPEPVSANPSRGADDGS